jgi:hypothetical protein
MHEKEQDRFPVMEYSVPDPPPPDDDEDDSNDDNDDDDEGGGKGGGRPVPRKEMIV